MKKWLGRDGVRQWLAIVGAATLVIGVAYTMVQQSTRLAVDDLPLQTAQNIKHQLGSGATPQDVVPVVKTNLRDDSTVFVIVTNGSQDVLASSANLDGSTPVPPSGVFGYTTAHSTDHFTWQPDNGVRLATRVVPYSSGGGGYIITGQSLKQAEDRIKVYGELALAAWLAMAAWVTLILFFLKPASSKKYNVMS